MAISFVFSNGTNVPMQWSVASSGEGLLASGQVQSMSNASGTVSGGASYRAGYFWQPQAVLRSAQFTGDTEITFAVTATPL